MARLKGRWDVCTLTWEQNSAWSSSVITSLSRQTWPSPALLSPRLVCAVLVHSEVPESLMTCERLYAKGQVTFSRDSITHRMFIGLVCSSKARSLYWWHCLFYYHWNDLPTCKRSWAPTVKVWTDAHRGWWMGRHVFACNLQIYWDKEMYIVKIK